MPGKSCGTTLAAICRTSEVSRVFIQFDIAFWRHHIKITGQNQHKICFELLAGQRAYERAHSNTQEFD